MSDGWTRLADDCAAVSRRGAGDVEAGVIERNTPWRDISPVDEWVDASEIDDDYIGEMPKNPMVTSSLRVTGEYWSTFLPDPDEFF